VNCLERYVLIAAFVLIGLNQNQFFGIIHPHKHFANALKETATQFYNWLLPSNHGFYAGQINEERVGQRGGSGFA
jgi:hypothetical protein